MNDEVPDSLAERTPQLERNMQALTDIANKPAPSEVLAAAANAYATNLIAYHSAVNLRVGPKDD